MHYNSLWPLVVKKWYVAKHPGEGLWCDYAIGLHVYVSKLFSIVVLNLLYCLSLSLSILQSTPMWWLIVTNQPVYQLSKMCMFILWIPFIFFYLVVYVANMCSHYFVKFDSVHLYDIFTCYVLNITMLQTLKPCSCIHIVYVSVA